MTEEQDEMNTRAVLARAYAVPAAAEVESALGLVRFRLPARRPRNWLGGLMKIAAALVLLGGTFAAGMVTAGYRPVRTSGSENSFFSSHQPALLARAPGSASIPLRPGASLSVPEALRPIRGFRFEAWEIYTNGSRRKTRETTLPADSRSALHISLRYRDNDNVPVRNGNFRVDANLIVHAFDDRVYLGGRIESEVPVQVLAPTEGQPFRVRFERTLDAQHHLLVPGETAWLYINGEPRANQRNVAIAVTPITGVAVRAGTISSSAELTTGFGAVSVEVNPVLQGARLRLETGDGTRWTTILDAPRLMLTDIAQYVDLPGSAPEPRLLVVLGAPSPGSLCFSWHWADRRNPSGTRCFATDPKVQAPLTMPLYGSAGGQLRLTLLGTF